MKKSLVLVFLLTLCNSPLLSQTGPRSGIVHKKKMASVHLPPYESAAALQTIYSNLGTSKTNLYSDEWGHLVNGPNAEGADGSAMYYAMQFTPKEDSHVSRVYAALAYNGTGANQANLSIYSDTDGVPGTLLAGPVTVANFPLFNGSACCALAVANFTPLAVTAGTQYWVVANTPTDGTGSDFNGVWALVLQGDTPTPALYTDDTWGLLPGLTVAAGAVLGTIP